MALLSKMVSSICVRGRRVTLKRFFIVRDYRNILQKKVMQTQMLISMMSIVDPGSEVVDGCTVVTVSKCL